MKKLGTEKKNLIAFMMMLLSFGSYAQIELLYDTDITLSVQYFKTDAGVYYYYVDVSNNQVVILNRDMSVYKKVSVDFETTYPNILFPSDKLFNDDSLIEFVVSEYIEIREGSQFVDGWSYSVLYNENGEELYDFGKRYLDLLHDADGEMRLFATSSWQKAGLQIYKLPGKSQVVNTNARVLPASSNPAYPNPSTTIVNLPYKLEPGSSSLMSIYSAGGSLIDQKQLDANIDRIMLDVSNYQPGVYMYEYDGISSRFVVY